MYKEIMDDLKNPDYKGLTMCHGKINVEGDAYSTTKADVLKNRNKSKPKERAAKREITVLDMIHGDMEVKGDLYIETDLSEHEKKIKAMEDRITALEDQLARI